MKSVIAIVVIALAVLSIPQTSLAWGGRGHHTICDAAVFLVKNDELREFLKSRPHVMGHLCNIPDIHWRALEKDITNEGNPTHIFDSEYLPVPIKDIPTDFTKLVAENTGKKGLNGKVANSIPHQLGSLWWRADHE